MAKASRKVSICRNSTLRSVMIDQTQLEVELQEIAAMAAPIHHKQAVQSNLQPTILAKSPWDIFKKL